MTKNTADEWEDIGRSLLYAELVYDVQEQFEETLYAVGEDIADGKELTDHHLEQLVWLIEEFLLLIRECIVPLVDGSTEWQDVFRLAEYPR